MYPNKLNKKPLKGGFTYFVKKCMIAYNKSYSYIFVYNYIKKDRRKDVAANNALSEKLVRSHTPLASYYKGAMPLAMQCTSQELVPVGYQG